VNDVDKLKQRVIEVLAGCVQQTVVDEATGERKITAWVRSRVKQESLANANVKRATAVHV